MIKEIDLFQTGVDVPREGEQKTPNKFTVEGSFRKGPVRYICQKQGTTEEWNGMNRKKGGEGTVETITQRTDRGVRLTLEVCPPMKQDR